MSLPATPLHPVFCAQSGRRPRAVTVCNPLLVALLLTALTLVGGLLPLEQAHAASAQKAARETDKAPAKKVASQSKSKATASKSAQRRAATRKQRSKAAASAKKSRTTKLASKTRTASKKKSRASTKRKSASVQRVAHKRASTVRAVARPTMGTAFGLHQTDDPLDLRSSVAYVYEPASGRVLFEKNSGVVLPIASITKLMTAIVVLDAAQSPREMLTITSDDIDRLRNSSSRLAVGTRLSRAEMLQLALMSSANRAAHALGRHYPGGLKAFVSAMNAKAMLFGMTDTRFSDPTGLSGANVSSATDLARLVEMASEYPLIRKYSTATGLRVDTGYRRLNFHNTNRLIANESWSIGLQKTGYIAEAGRCLVMQARIDGRELVMVLLDSNGSRSRFADAGRIRKWLQRSGPQIVAAGDAAAIN